LTPEVSLLTFDDLKTLCFSWLFGTTPRHAIFRLPTSGATPYPATPNIRRFPHPAPPHIRRHSMSGASLRQAPLYAMRNSRSSAMSHPVTLHVMHHSRSSCCCIGQKLQIQVVQGGGSGATGGQGGERREWGEERSHLTRTILHVNWS
jgi:hypothetical protein